MKKNRNLVQKTVVSGIRSVRQFDATRYLVVLQMRSTVAAYDFDELEDFSNKFLLSTTQNFPNDFHVNITNLFLTKYFKFHRYPRTIN